MSRGKSISISVFLALYLSTCLSYTRHNKLVISHEETVLHEFFPADGNTFTIGWIHSVEDEAWEETFEIQNGVITLISTRFRTFGAGVPFDHKDMIIDSGWVKADGYSYRIDSFYLRVGENTQHRVFLGEESFKLPHGRVHIFVESR